MIYWWLELIACILLTCMMYLLSVKATALTIITFNLCLPSTAIRLEPTCLSLVVCTCLALTPPLYGGTGLGVKNWQVWVEHGLPMIPLGTAWLQLNPVIPLWMGCTLDYSMTSIVSLYWTSIPVIWGTIGVKLLSTTQSCCSHHSF